MADIDIGSPAIDRNVSWGTIRTTINKDNPANLSGKITSVEIWAKENMSNCEVATFYVVSGNSLSTRDTQAVGSVTAGSKQTFEVDLNVEEGDYLGIYYTAGDIELSSADYVGVWHSGPDTSDLIPCTNHEFGYTATKTMSLYGTGTTKEDNVIFFGCDF